MCLSVIGEIEALDGEIDSLSRTARVRFGSLRKVVNVSLVPEVETGDHVLVHAGIAIQILDPAEATRTLALLEGVSTGAPDAPAAASEKERERGPA